MNDHISSYATESSEFISVFIIIIRSSLIG